MSSAPLLDTLATFWDQAILPALTDYIRIPALSPDFDADWAEHGHLDRARRLALDWLEAQREDDWIVHDLALTGLTPLILVEIPGQGAGDVLLYGHLDKQPEMEGWRADLGPWKPVIENGKLYGRGGADDGYALFAAAAALKALRRHGRPHPRCLILIEFSEESGSPHLPPYLEQYGHLIGTPDLVIALDSGTGDYERLWSTTSLRGMQGCTVTVRTLHEAAHSGIASGIVPESFAVMRQILDRLEDSATGRVLLEDLHVDIPEIRRRQAREAAEILGMSMVEGLHPLPGLKPLSDDPYELILNNTWRPSLCVVGQDGLPPVSRAGNVMRAYTSLKLSFRLPPPLRCEEAKRVIEAAVRRDPPFGAQVEIRFDQGGDGWEAPPPADWLLEACDRASQTYYGHKAAHLGLGASIPFMKMLGDTYPNAQFLITGVLGPGSNAHGPNEFLHIPYAKKLTACVAEVVAAVSGH
ncbi:MAG TPA: M20/M25/M40 family metallo-hydrolase [Methylothermaceae bacterium]|nr:M20/M25/M40 family metallo-hydrolase [Methylothermaceae bacterium]